MLWTLVAALVLAGLWTASAMVRMPSKSHTGPLPSPTAAQLALALELERDVRRLAEEIGERNLDRYDALERARAFVYEALAASGEPTEQVYVLEGRPCANVSIEIRGRKAPDEIAVVGAHYDSVAGSPGS